MSVWCDEMAMAMAMAMARSNVVVQAHVQVVHGVKELLERGSLGGVDAPTGGDDVVELGRAARRLLEAIALRLAQPVGQLERIDFVVRLRCQ